MTDKEIAESVELKHISLIASELGLDEDSVEYYGKYKANL